MYELTNDPFYETYMQFDSCFIDYCLAKSEEPYQGESSHREALEFFMETLAEEAIFPWKFDIGKAKGNVIDTASFFVVPRLLRKDRHGNNLYDSDYSNPKVNEKMPYWYAFLEPPIEAGRHSAEEFEMLNNALFPNGIDSVEVYDWSTDWSDYFNSGHEWWGASCWTCYDKSLDRYAVILVSFTE